MIASYAVIKERYLSASSITNEDSFHYEAQKNYGYFLDKRYSEIEFDWYEDVETNIPLHLGSMTKILEAFSAFYNSDKVRAEQIGRFYSEMKGFLLKVNKEIGNTILQVPTSTTEENVTMVTSETIDDSFLDPSTDWQVWVSI